MCQNHYHMLTSRSLFFPYVNLTQHFGLFTLTLQGFNWCFSRKATGSHRLFCPQTFFWASSQAKQVHVHSRPQRPRFFWSAPRIATSGPSQRSRFLVLAKRSAASGDENGACESKPQLHPGVACRALDTSSTLSVLTFKPKANVKTLFKFLAFFFLFFLQCSDVWTSVGCPRGMWWGTALQFKTKPNRKSSNFN